MQRAFAFLSILPPPKPAARSLVARIETDAQAIAVSLIGSKQAYVAAQLNVSEGYLSGLKKGRYAVPEWFVHPFCVLTNCALLAQVRALRDAQDFAAGIEAATIRRMAAELRSAAA